MTIPSPRKECRDGSRALVRTIALEAWGNEMMRGATAPQHDFAVGVRDVSTAIWWASGEQVSRTEERFEPEQQERAAGMTGRSARGETYSLCFVLSSASRSKMNVCA